MTYPFPISLFFESKPEKPTFSQDEYFEVFRKQQEQVHLEQKKNQEISLAKKNLHTANLHTCSLGIITDAMVSLGEEYRTEEGSPPLSTILEQRLQQSKNINVQDEKGDTLLHHVMRYGDKGFTIVQNIIKYNAVDPNILNHKGQSALHIAVELKAAQLIQCLQKYTTDDVIWQSFLKEDSRDKDHSAGKIKNAIQNVADPYEEPIVKPEYVALHILNKQWNKAFTQIKTQFNKLAKNKTSYSDIIPFILKTKEKTWVFLTFHSLFESNASSYLGFIADNAPFYKSLQGPILFFSLENNQHFLNSLSHDSANMYRALRQLCKNKEIALSILEKHAVDFNKLPLQHKNDIIGDIMAIHLGMELEKRLSDKKVEEMRLEIINIIKEDVPSINSRPSSSKR